MKKMLVVDGNSILNRAFYGIRLLTNKDGLYTNAVYGMINILSRHLEQLHPDYCAVAFDLKAPTFRHKMYDGYKANRKGMPDELAVQLPYAKECMKHLGLNVITCEGYEADDILGTLAAVYGKENTHVYILTGDRDSLQLITPNVSVLLVKTKETLEMTPEAFFAEYGIPSSEFVDVKALMGDSSDNIPGVAGIGEKTALKLIAQYHSIEELYDGLTTSTLTENTKKKLLDGKDMAELSRTLAKICCEVPIDTDPSHYRYEGPNVTELRDLFVQLDFTALIKKFGLEDAVESKKTESHPEEKPIVSVCQSLSELTGTLCFVSLSENTVEIFDGVNYIEWHYQECDVCDWNRWIQGKSLVCHDSKQLYKTLSSLGLSIPTVSFDIMLAAYVLDSGRTNYSLEELCIRYLNEPLSKEMPITLSLARLYPILKGEIQSSRFDSLLYEIEMPLALVLADMEHLGFKVDCDGIERYGMELKEAADTLQERIYCYAGEEFNISSPKQLGEILFEKMSLPKFKKTKTGYSTDAETLQKLIPYHPIIEDILDYRQVTKLKSTYADGLIKAADSENRVHSIFNQTGTATGRLSSSEPNLQNIPVRTELGREFRKFFIPKNKDYLLIDADYSQIELRLLAHIANDSAMIDLFLSGKDIHTMTAAKVFHVPPEQVTADLRKKAKAVNFGIMYGIGEYSLSEDLSISRAEAKEYIENYFAQFPSIREYLDRVQVEAKESGYATTFFGRRRYIPEILSSNKNLQHFGERVAMNSPIQGSASDIIKIAMISVAKELSERKLDASLILQVHDELLIESHRDCAEEVQKILIKCMESAADLTVPLLVDAHIGKTWFDAK
ncbi:MAG: DNA polymerase I [Clostridia bacterium]|nr:DNA polymerase I [Clostridia bacterium]